MRARNFVDLTGRVFGRLVVIGRAVGRDKRSWWWLCRCSAEHHGCGTYCTVRGYVLARGETSSCGCLSLEMLHTKSATHGHARVAKKTPAYVSWAAMRQRCYDPARANYKYYGGRGIIVCDRWRNDFSAFLADMGPRPSSKHSIDRIDPNGNYEPGNCRWATQSEQCRNQRTRADVTRVEAFGIRLTVAEWSARTGLSSRLIHKRVRSGATAEETLRAAQPRERRARAS